MKSVKFSSEETSKRPSQSLSLEAQAKRRKFLAKFKITKEKLNKDDILSIIKAMNANLNDPTINYEEIITYGSNGAARNNKLRTVHN